MKNVFLHKNFIEHWQSLAFPERDSVQRMVLMLKDGHITSGMRPHPVGPFLSFSPNMDIRIIAVNRQGQLTLVHVGHHDAAYKWANQRGILITDTGSPELINIQDFQFADGETATFSLPIPIREILNIENSDHFLHAILEMSPEWQEWLFTVYTREREMSAPPTSSSLVFSPNNDEDLARALDLDILSWQMFLHPTQREIVEHLEHSSIAITGGPGTGKTVVLLNRVLTHAPKGKEKDITLLLTYSANLAGYLFSLIRERAINRHFQIFPMYFLGGKLPATAKSDTMFKKYELEIVDGKLFLRYKNEPPRFVRELLVDELQDAPQEALDMLKCLISSGSTRVVLATDMDQSIHRTNKSIVDATITLCAKHYELTYCYRSTKQILDKAIAWFSSKEVSITHNRTFGLSGPSVRFVQARDLGHQVEICADIMRDIEQRYDSSSLALIYCQYFNPSFKGNSKEEELLKSHPELKSYYHFASTTKGKEFYAGIVFVSASFLAKDMGKEANRLRVNTLYVALTRFRSEVTVVFPKGCAIEHELHQLSG